MGDVCVDHWILSHVPVGREMRLQGWEMELGGRELVWVDGSSNDARFASAREVKTLPTIGPLVGLD